MKGNFERSGKQYEWWAGQSNPDAKEDWCVHCRSGDWGVTQYLSAKPSEQSAEKHAKEIADHVDRLA